MNVLLHVLVPVNEAEALARNKGTYNPDEFTNPYNRALARIGRHAQQVLDVTPMARLTASTHMEQED